MGKEIERKFKVIGTAYKTESISSAIYKQGYLSVDKERTVRVRVVGDKAFLTIKGQNCGIVRNEFEYEIPVADAEIMLNENCLQPVIEKVRHICIASDGHKWEIDEFAGENAGLVWEKLKDNRHWEYEELKSATGLTDRDLNAAIGWLAREDKIDFDVNEHGDRIFLTINVFIG